MPPVPLRTAPALPLDAVEPLFFFGTLMDLDVLGLVVGRAILDEELAPAVLPRFRREAARDVPWPVLVGDPGAAVEGRLWSARGRLELERINRYEAGEYRAELHRVHDPRVGSREAWVHIGDGARIVAAGRPWDLGSWAREHKRTTLEEAARSLGLPGPRAGTLKASGGR